MARPGAARDGAASGEAGDGAGRVQGLPGITLDRTIVPGSKEKERWQQSVAGALSVHPEFTRTGERAVNLAAALRPKRDKISRTLAVWQFTPGVRCT